jgi:glycosyltransferase involved in cell wall biosynthesis
VRLSVVIVAFNEEDRLPACLESVRWADEVIVVDSHSTDGTREVARRFGARVIERDWPGYVAQKNFALEQAQGEWILSLDADEAVSPELAQEIHRVLADPPAGVVAFSMPRKTWYLGRWILHGGWYPDRKVRLVRRGCARWEGDDPHDRLVPNGPTAPLRGDIYHRTYRNFGHQIQIIDRFSEVVVGRYLEKYRRFRRGWIVPLMVLHPPWKFFECYVWKGGFLDGVPGFVIAMASAFYVFAKYAKAWERRNTRG